MNESQSRPGLTPEQSARLTHRTESLIRLVIGDSPALALDSLLSAYATVAANFGQAQKGAHMLRMLADILENNPLGNVQQAIDGIPRQLLKVPMPDLPSDPLPEGYASDDVARIAALVASVLDLLEGEKGHNALSALITSYSQVADHLGEVPKAGRVLLENGARMVARSIHSPGQAGDPVPPVNANLH